MEAWEPSLLTMSIQKPLLIPHKTWVHQKSSSVDTKSVTVIDGVEGFQKCLAPRGIAKLISNPRKGSSVSS